MDAVGDALPGEEHVQERCSFLLEENRSLAKNLVQAQEQERRRLGTELHDELGPWLTALQADAEVLNQLAGNHDPELAASARGVIEDVQQIHAAIRRVLNNLRPLLLVGARLTDSLKELVQHAEHVAGGPAIKLYLADGLDRIGAPIDVATYRIVQESLTNVLKHAAASSASVKLQIHQPPDSGPSLLITVADDGVGMDVDVPIRGYGIAGMRERARALGGTIHIDHGRHGGVCVSARLPLGNTPTAP